jgi:hypothetical protein
MRSYALGHSSANLAENRYLRYGSTPRRLIVATATRFCDTGNDSDYGNHLNRLAVANKMDFVHLHGYELWVHDEQVTAGSPSSLLRMHCGLRQAVAHTPDDDRPTCFVLW